ncbi:amidohydrolase [Pseudopedobacter saltans DSM 12145]|uniref:Amidohydrolase n=1 Tax=Pseudopedobacter saltans (strain ATCC 51119 / DSM 12145 / JCM 21818 / CCUG 39354 / LMG 10337 / NBRC 100064 / NCIMB 13643) TaxID=762903 RepID=F0S4M6_PSESL|nr:M20 family metallopeptidase [Pseudopedobacter saltans]ADY52017.1 amidohydrolase [Pseudopedobacter saltans DSM 12145]
METTQIKAFNNKIDESIEKLLPELEDIYKDIHRNPELSMQEFRTAKIATDYLTKYQYEVSTQIGTTGVVGLMKNGEGPTVMLRADMDALPITEATGLPYASTKVSKNEDGIEVGVSHVCGHDIHVTWLMGAARLFSEHKDQWKGTLMVVFQPGEEVGRGAQAMIDDGMMDRFPKPDIILGQHVMVGEAGTVRYRSGPILSAGNSLKVKLFGRGAHGSQPQTSIDPVIMAASATMRLQTIISREIAPIENAVLTIGSLQAGTKENIIPEDATIKLNIRTFNDSVKDHILSAVKRICCAECAASNAPRDPEFTPIDSYPMTVNDVAATARLAKAFEAQFGDKSFETKPASASEDFSVFGRNWNVPYVFWFVGGTDPKIYLDAKKNNLTNTIPSNHSPKFAPVINPTLKTGLLAMITAALAWLD